MNTFNNLKTIIALGKKSKEEMLGMMDVFLMNNRITSDQYDELAVMLG